MNTGSKNSAAGISTRYMDVTPDLAAEWLEGNVRNRPVNQAHVNRLAEEMKAGRWKTTHQGIAFDADGTLVDGQQRLWAIFVSGCTVRMAVSRGLSPDSIEDIDSGRGRSATDRMSISGRFGPEKVNRNHAATLREMVCGLNLKGRLTYHQEVELMTRHIEAVRYANSHVATMTRGINVACVRAVVARSWYSVDREQLARFCRVLCAGMPESTNDAPIIKLRDLLMAAGNHRNGALRREIYGKVEWVLANWLKGESRSVLRTAAQEYFPLPEEAKKGGETNKS